LAMFWKLYIDSRRSDRGLETGSSRGVFRDAHRPPNSGTQPMAQRCNRWWGLVLFWMSSRSLVSFFYRKCPTFRETAVPLVPKAMVRLPGFASSRIHLTR
jgi:hypothetical protein